jgi:hypothetical protein
MQNLRWNLSAVGVPKVLREQKCGGRSLDAQQYDNEQPVVELKQQINQPDVGSKILPAS